MISTKNGECQCGFPGVTVGVTRVHMKGPQVVACEMCNPDLAQEAELDPDELVEASLRVIAQRYRKPDDTFYIYQVSYVGPNRPGLPDGVKKPFGLTGPIGQFDRGDVVTVFGKFGSSPKYGFQLECTTAARLAVKESESALIAFLRKFPFVGPVRSGQILKMCGSFEGVLDVLDNDHRRLTEVSGITEDRADEIKTEYDKLCGFREFRMFAAKLGLTETTIAEALDEWEDQAQSVIEENPFSLMHFDRIGFKTADEIRHKLGIDQKSPHRCAAGVEEALKLSLQDGHTYTTLDELYGSIDGRAGDEARRLGLSKDEVDVGLSILLSSSYRIRRGIKQLEPPKVVRDDLGRLMLTEIYTAEFGIAKEIKRLQAARLREVSFDDQVWGDMDPSEAQIEALKEVCRSPVTICCGSAGTGKSTVVNTITKVLEGAGHKVAMCAPTGKSAKRLSEVTGKEASTIHRLTGYHGTSSDRFMIEASVVVADELSMVCVELLHVLLSSCQTGTRIVLVGDTSQLPSIGPGRVLHDLIESNTIPVVKLTQIHRQQSDDTSTRRIISVSQDINNGVCPDLDVKGTDVVFLPFEDPELLQQKIVTAVTEQIPQKYGFSAHEIQVIAPQKGEEHKKNWPIGVKALNLALQEKLNPPKNSPGHKDITLHIGDGYITRVGDRVIQVKNNYDLGLVNGDQGIVVQVEQKAFSVDDEVMTSEKGKRAKDLGRDRDDVVKRGEDIEHKRHHHHKGHKKNKPAIHVIVDYQGYLVGYERDELKELHLSYALTVHKVQGSESRAIVMPVHDVNSFMLTRQLLYTAVTRAREYVLLLGQESRVAKTVKNTRGVESRTVLQEYLTSHEILDLTKRGAVVNFRLTLSSVYETRLETDL